MVRSDLSQTKTGALADACAEQTARFQRQEASDPRYCLELFRRALSDGDDHAWRCVYGQYRPLVASWVRRHANYPTSGEEPQYFVNRAFEKLWSAVSPAFPFVELAQVLRYLQMCVHSVIMDHVRAAEQATIRAQAELPETLASSVIAVEREVTEALAANGLLSAIYARLNDERERAVVYAAYVLGLKPQEICAWSPMQFADVGQVYRIKENVLARLRRDEELKRALGHT